MFDILRRYLCYLLATHCVTWMTIASRPNRTVGHGGYDFEILEVNRVVRKQEGRGRKFNFGACSEVNFHQARSRGYIVMIEEIGARF